VRRIDVPLTARIAVMLLAFLSSARADELSPARWPAGERERAEKREALGWTPAASRNISGRLGVISAIASPIAVQAGIAALESGGTAADAAATVTLTQITTQLGSVVSFAGIMSLVYYDARTDRVYSLDAGYQSYRNETDPKSIPIADMGPLNSTFQPLRGGAKPGGSSAKGRETLVPGLMAGVEAMHKRFGRLPFPELFEPAIWYAENGIAINPPLAGCFNLRKTFLARTSEGKLFLKQGGSEVPRLGDRFKQPELAKTLRGVASQGSQYMYTGPWGKEFMRLVQREGGKVTFEDLQNYRANWTEPLSTVFAGHRVYAAGEPSYAAYNILPALNLAAELGLEKRPSYWKDPKVLVDLQRIGNATEGAPGLTPGWTGVLKAKRIDASRAAQLTQAYARSVAPLLGAESGRATDEPRHSNSVVVVDKEGNVAAITHTINSVIWGDTGIVVGGIPIPDSAGFQQERLASLKPGDRLPNEMVQTIVFEGDKPMLATAGIGSSLIPETLKIVLCVVGKGLALSETQAAPALLSSFGSPGATQTAKQLSLSVAEGSYTPDFIKGLESGGAKVTRLPAASANGLRGTVAAVVIDQKSGERSTVETKGVLLFGGRQ
jgi:gamma-glutamyltranspeptidase / glutathione hydrolase